MELSTGTLRAAGWAACSAELRDLSERGFSFKIIQMNSTAVNMAAASAAA